MSDKLEILTAKMLLAHLEHHGMTKETAELAAAIEAEEPTANDEDSETDLEMNNG